MRRRIISKKDCAVDWVSAFVGLFTPTVGGVVEICGLPVDIGFGILFADEDLTFSTLDNFFSNGRWTHFGVK